MKTYARIQDGAVAELFTTAFDIGSLFNHELVWVDVTGTPTGLGWIYDGAHFAAPLPRVTPAPAPATLAELQAQLQILSAQIAALMHA